MAHIPYLYRRLLYLGVPAEVATQVADTDYDGTLTTNLADLADVQITDPAEGDLVAYDGESWTNVAGG